MNGDFRPLTPEERTELDNFTMKELEGNNGWRPIEEAPKDGAEVLLHEPGVVTVGFWSNNRKRWIDATDDEHDRTYRFEPTHFLPLPNPPKK